MPRFEIRTGTRFDARSYARRAYAKRDALEELFGDQYAFEVLHFPDTGDHGVMARCLKEFPDAIAEGQILN
jgi:hypothetical protein